MFSRGTKVDVPSVLMDLLNKRSGLVGHAFPPRMGTNSLNRLCHLISGGGSCFLLGDQWC